MIKKSTFIVVKFINIDKKNNLKRFIMSESKERIGGAWEVKFENSSKPKFNVLVDPKKIADLPANN